MADSKELGIADVPVRPGLGASLHTLQSKDVNFNEGEEGTSPVDIENSTAPTPSIVKIRSNLRTFLVLTSLYVCLPFFHPWKTRTDLDFPAHDLHCRSRPDYRLHCYPHHCQFPPFREGVYVDWRRVPHRQYSRRAHLDETVRYLGTETTLAHSCGMVLCGIDCVCEGY